MKMNRKAYVAGQFYPGSRDGLLNELSRLCPHVEEKADAIAVITPHAGYMYSGAVAGSVWSSVDIPEKIIILCPNHTGLGQRCSIMSSGVWEIPLGTIPVDEELAEKIKNNTTLVQEDHTAHAFEHSLEVQLPFIAYLKKNFSFVPIALKSLSLKQCEELGNAIAETIIDTGERVLLAASTDMSHYEPDEVAREKDKKAIDEILKLNPRGLYTTVQEYGITMCGYIPTTVVLYAAQKLGASTAKLVKYATSGEVSGDYDQVVGYAGIYVS